METKKNLGIWMDHAIAHLMDNRDSTNNETISSNFNHDDKVDALNRSESLMHNKKQQLDEAFYKNISEKILKYQHVLLFGPTNAKSELYNYLNKNLHFKDVKIDVEAADKMTDNEQSAFVKKHFANQH